MSIKENLLHSIITNIHEKVGKWQWLEYCPLKHYASMCKYTKYCFMPSYGFINPKLQANFECEIPKDVSSSGIKYCSNTYPLVSPGLLFTAIYCHSTKSTVTNLSYMCVNIWHEALYINRLFIHYISTSVAKYSRSRDNACQVYRWLGQLVANIWSSENLYSIWKFIVAELDIILCN